MREHYADEVVRLTGFHLPPPKGFLAKGGDDAAAGTRWEEWGIQPPGEDGATDAHCGTVAALAAADGEVNVELVCGLVEHIVTHEAAGAILIFVPGALEIKRIVAALERLRTGQEIRALPLSSALTSEEQALIFKDYGPGVRKVVVSTNIAETSITVDDVTHVVDTGRMKETRFDPRLGMDCLVETWVSQAAAQQRRGRAGRTRPGQCWRLYTEQAFRRFEPQQQPEIRRVSIEQLCLRILVMARDVREYLAGMLDGPSDEAVAAALQALRDLSAIDAEQRITSLGRHLSQIPVDLRVGKILVFASMLGCIEPALTVAACMSFRSFFLSPAAARDEANRAKARFADGKSDLLTHLNAYDAWVEAGRGGGRAERSFCHDNFLSYATLRQVRDIRRQYRSALAELGFVARSDGEVDPAVLKAVLCAGLYPRVARVAHPSATYSKTAHGAFERDAEARNVKFFTKDGGRVFLHPASVNFGVGRFESPFVAYMEKVQTSKIFLRDATMVSPYSVLFFGGKLGTDPLGGTISVDGWLKFRAPGRVAVLIGLLRRAVDAVLDKKIDEPGLRIEREPAIAALLQLLAADGRGA